MCRHLADLSLSTISLSISTTRQFSLRPNNHRSSINQGGLPQHHLSTHTNGLHGLTNSRTSNAYKSHHRRVPIQYRTRPLIPKTMKQIRISVSQMLQQRHPNILPSSRSPHHRKRQLNRAMYHTLANSARTARGDVHTVITRRKTRPKDRKIDTKRKRRVYKNTLTSHSITHDQHRNKHRHRHHYPATGSSSTPTQMIRVHQPPLKIGRQPHRTVRAQSIKYMTLIMPMMTHNDSSPKYDRHRVLAIVRGIGIPTQVQQ